MHRLVLHPLTLSDGTHLPQNSVIGVSAVETMWDPTLHRSPTRFDGHRFHRMRTATSDPKPANHQQAHLVSTSPSHLAFGHGRHACAGRFFVAHEAKIALGHLLLRYEWKVARSSAGTKPMEFGLVLAADPKVKVSIRGRRSG